MGRKGIWQKKNLLYELENGNGKVNEYDENLRYDGEYLDGKRHGKGKEFNSIGSLIYEGNFSKGEWNGFGKKNINDELVYEGEFLNGEIK